MANIFNNGPTTVSVHSAIPANDRCPIVTINSHRHPQYSYETIGACFYISRLFPHPIVMTCDGWISMTSVADRRIFHESKSASKPIKEQGKQKDRL